MGLEREVDELAGDEILAGEAPAADPSRRGLVRRLCQRFVTLDAQDAAQYAAEAELACGPAASAAALWAYATRRCRADGYDAPWMLMADQEDDEGRRISWEAQLSDQGAGMTAILARAGLGRSSRRRATWSARKRRQVWRTVIRLLAQGSAVEQRVLWRRLGRYLAGGEPEPFRRVAEAAGVALGTAWNIEHRAKHRVITAAATEEPKPDQLSWVTELDEDPAGRPVTLPAESTGPRLKTDEVGASL